VNTEDVRAEQALLDLNDLKSEIYKDKKENSETIMRRTTNQMQRTHVSDGFTSAQGSKAPPTETQGFGFTKMTSFTANQHVNYDELTADQLKERLMVAETIMKRLYNRNKELETYHSY
jgi:hypothetical protein